MKLALTLPERYALIAILPAKGPYSTMKRANELRGVLEISDEERKAPGITELKDADDVPTGEVRWNAQARAADREIEIGQTMTDNIKATLSKLDDKGELAASQVTLYEKFVEAGEPKDAKSADKNETPEG